ncbi:hypothetical protein D3C86_2062450 [compost metagenome]
MASIIGNDQRTVNIQVTAVVAIQVEGIGAGSSNIDKTTVLDTKIICCQGNTGQSCKIRLCCYTCISRHLVVEASDNAIEIATDLQGGCVVVGVGLIG